MSDLMEEASARRVEEEPGSELSYIVRANDRVDAVLAEAERAEGKIARPAQDAYGGRFGYFTDPDGYLWKVAAGPVEQSFVAE